MNGLQGTLQFHRGAQFLQGEVGSFGQQSAQLAAVSGDNHRLASGQMMPRSNVAGAPSLLQELLDHAQGHAESVGNLGARAFLVVIRKKDSLTKIQR
jgi:hypothetical protein